MGILDRIRLSLSAKARLVERLASAAGRYEILADKLKRHAELCNLPNIKAGLGHLAEAETAQVITLRRILSDVGTRPRPAEASSHDGSSNWERVSADLAYQIELFRELTLQIAQWEGIDATMAERLRDFLVEEDRSVGILRDLALKCDPQALD